MKITNVRLYTEGVIILTFGFFILLIIFADGITPLRVYSIITDLWFGIHDINNSIEKEESKNEKT